MKSCTGFRFYQHHHPFLSTSKACLKNKTKSFDRSIVFVSFIYTNAHSAESVDSSATKDYVTTIDVLARWSGDGGRQQYEGNRPLRESEHRCSGIPLRKGMARDYKLLAFYWSRTCFDSGSCPSKDGLDAPSPRYDTGMIIGHVLPGYNNRTARRW